MNSETEQSSDDGRSGSAAATCFKVPFLIINVLTWIGGGTLIGVAIWMVSTENEYKHFIEDQSIFIVYISLAAVLFTAGILGTCGVLLGNKVLLKTYFVFVCLVFCTLFGLLIFGVVERSRIDEIVTSSWNKTSDDTRIFIQKKFDCCDVGKNNTKTKSYKDDSCYVNATTKYEVKMDCLSKLTEWFEEHQITIAICGAAVMLLLIILMIGTCWLVKKLSDNRNWKITRVSPAQSETNGAFHIREPGQANEMVSIEEDPEEHVYTQVKRKDHTKTAKQERQHQRKGWAKNTSNSPLVN